MSRKRIGELSIGQVPRVVGSITQGETLDRIGRLTDLAFDIAEIRWDTIGTGKAAVLSTCRLIEKSGAPVLLTIRSSQEGGAWNGEDARRLALYKKALSSVSAVDIEISSSIFRSVINAARKAGKTVVGSFHDFERTPAVEELCDIIRTGRRAGADIVKVATAIHGPADIAALFSVLKKEGKKPLCLIGMGEVGIPTRVTLACAGSCLAYGYADRSAAPGQMPSSTLMRRLRKSCPSYERDYLSRHGLAPA